MQILVVEDNENSRVLLESALAANGYKVASAENGKLALAQAVLHPPDLIISDILMPEMDGYALCQAVRADEQLCGIPFIFYTATYTDPQNEKLAMDFGADKFIVKPMEIDLLLSEIRAVLENEQEKGITSSAKPEKNEFELQKAYSETIARKIEEKVRELEEEKTLLTASEKKYRRLIEVLRDNYFFYALDESGALTYLSPSIVNVLGYSPKEFQSQFPSLIRQADSDTGIMDYTGQSMQGIRQPPYEIEVSHKDGSLHWLEITEEPVLNDKGQVKTVECIAHDITKRIKTQAETKELHTRLNQAQKMEAIGTLAGGIAHDFNNILSAIIGYTELTKMMVAGDEKISGYLNKVMEAGNRAKELVQQILTFSRQAEKELKPVPIKIIIKEALKLLRASLPATIEIKHDLQSNSMVMADPSQIHQLIMNLCVNAGHAMREKGGILEVNLKDVLLDAESLPNFPDVKPGLYLNLTVGDTGEGMSNKVLERIFNPFYSTQERGEGTGMGLSVVHGIVKSYHGAIQAFSDLGRGTTFNIFLPTAETVSGSDEGIDEELPKGTETILFIDDEPSLVEIGEQMLKSLGYSVVSQTSSPGALDLFKAQPERFDLVITDMTMPQMTGDRLAREIFAIRKEMPVILCTGFSHSIAEDKSRHTGISGLLMKPIVRSEIARVVRTALDESKNTDDTQG